MFITPWDDINVIFFQRRHMDRLISFSFTRQRRFSLWHSHITTLKNFDLSMFLLKMLEQRSYVNGVNFIPYERYRQKATITTVISQGLASILTFAFLRTSSSTSSISCRHSSCIVWKDSCGPRVNSDSRMLSSCSRISGNRGRSWGFIAQHAGNSYGQEFND